ncbi:MAG: hypothetical protein KGL16_00590 [Acidobacteriota bacterium]|nr:hypothetical protein [Acidobacteriota bacterium]
MSLDQPTLEEFVRHAERYGSELVYETAAGHLEPKELGLLSLALQRLDRKWRLAPAQKTKLALALLETPLPLAQICEMSQLHRATLHRLRQEREQVRQAAETGADSAQPCGADVAQAPTPTTATATGEMRHARA